MRNRRASERPDFLGRRNGSCGQPLQCDGPAGKNLYSLRLEYSDCHLDRRSDTSARYPIAGFQTELGCRCFAAFTTRKLNLRTYIAKPTAIPWHRRPR
jgi:hypothetical protein